MSHAPQIAIPATYMRGGTSKGVFFRLLDLPVAAQVAGAARDALLLRVIGSPDPYGKQIDGMGGATSSTSKTVIVSKSSRADHDVDYLFGQVSIDKPFVDWSGNCGNLSAAVGPFAISNGLVDASRVPRDGIAVVRIWQANIGKTIIAHVPIANGAVQETGDFELDGVTFPAAEVQLEFMDPAADEEGAVGSMFPTGNLVDDLEVPGRRHTQGHDDQRRDSDDLRQCSCARLHRQRTAGRDQRRCAGACDIRDDSRARRTAHGTHQGNWTKRPGGSTRPRWRSSPDPRITRHRAASASQPQTSTCAYARCRWASCTTR